MYGTLDYTNKKRLAGIYILHFGTNDLALDDITEHIVNIATSLKAENNTVVVSNIVPNGDRKKEEAEAVNKLLVDIYEQKEIPLVDDGNINTKKHLNKSRLYLNAYGKSAFVKNLRNYFKNFNWSGIWNNRDKVKSSPPLTDPEINSLSDLTSIKLQRKENYENLIIGHLNIKSIRNKFEMVAEIIKDFDIFLISESKLYSTFPNAQLRITGFRIFRNNWNKFGGGLPLYVNDKIPSKFLNKQSISSDIELIAVEFHQNKHKGLSLYVYKPPNQNDSSDK